MQAFTKPVTSLSCGAIRRTSPGTMATSNVVLGFEPFQALAGEAVTAEFDFLVVRVGQSVEEVGLLGLFHDVDGVGWDGDADGFAALDIVRGLNDHS